jgi:DNA-binding protein H-NS
MATTNLDDLTLAELKKLAKDIDPAIASFDARQKQTVISALEEKAMEFGYALSDLFSDVIAKVKRRAYGKSRSKPVPKYANPADRSITWSGRGRQPQWYKDAVAEGKSPDSMLV